MSFHPKKALLSKLYEKHLEKERKDFAKEKKYLGPFQVYKNV